MTFKIKMFLATAFTIFTLGASLAGTMAWFTNTVTMSNMDVSGSSNGAFFDSGDGTTPETAFVIKTPKHFYNLAWLQDTGEFNKDTNDNGKINTVYFKLHDDLKSTGLNMSKYVIPPIGTEQYPFVGNFDGNGVVVQNATVSNNFADYGRAHPRDITAFGAQINQPNVVGLFGVVGSYSGQNLSYESSTNVITNLGILGATIRSATSTTLAGIAAGYVNGTIDNVGVNQSNLYTLQSASPITTVTSNVSDYSLVGFATDAYKHKVKLRSDDANIPTLYNPNTSSGGDNWGGSINMLDMYTYLRSKITSSTAFSFPTAETITVNSSGEETNRATTSSSTNGAYKLGGFSEYIRYHGNKTVVNDKEYASFSFVRTSGNQNFSSYNSDDTKYVCLYGAETRQGMTAGNSTTNYPTKTETISGTFFRIRYGNNGYYLRYNNGITRTNNASDTGTGWRWEGKYILTTVSNKNYYLTVNNGELTGNTTKTTEWEYDSTNGNLYTISNGTNYCLQYTNNAWSVFNTSYYTIHDDTAGGYVNKGNSYNLNSVSNTATTEWNYGISNNANSGYGYYVSSAWLMYYSSSYKAIVYSTSNSRYHYHLESDSDTGTGKLVAVNGSTKYYLYYQSNNSTFTCATNDSSKGDTFTVTKITGNYGTQNITMPTYSGTSSISGITPYYDTNATYFPLTREKTEDGSGYSEAGAAGKPDVKNTGYVISGCNLTTSSQHPYGDIRVARFEMSDISVALSGSSSYVASKLEIVTRTCVRGDNGSYTDSGWTRISDDYNSSNTASTTLSNTFSEKKNYKTELRLGKYKNSRSQLGNTLSNGGGGIYGLHFMNAAISKDNLATAPNVIVLDGKTLDGEGKATGSEYTNYQLPQDSIDFNLKDQGFINFFAGSYFTDNNTFFSLHKITRNNNNEIIAIQEIKKIYAPASGEPSNENPYVYSFDGNKPSGAGDLVFDTTWITAPTIVDDAVYYFEIPVNAGEFALGSVSGKNGAYLMYLDIGAGIDNYKDIVSTESISSSVQYAYYADGIDFQDFTGVTRTTTAIGGASSNIKVGTSVAQQKLCYSYTGTQVTIESIMIAEGEQSQPPAAQDPPVSVHYAPMTGTAQKKVGNTTTALNFSPPTLFTSVDEKESLESYNVFTSSVTRTVNETITFTGGVEDYTYQLAKPVLSSGFSETGAATFAVESGPATVNASTGLLTFTGSGTVKVTMTYSETMTGVEQWATANQITSDDTEGTIFEYHLRDFDNPNIVVYYSYDGPNHTYTLYVDAKEDTVLYIDNLPLAGYTVVVVVNGDTTNKTTLTSASTSITSIDITGSGYGS